MNHFKKIISILLIVSLVLTLFGGCGKTEVTDGDSSEPSTNSNENVEEGNTEEVVTLRFVNWGSAEESTKVAFEEMIKGFESENPNIRIDNVYFPYAQTLDQLLIMCAGDEAPDVAQLHGTWVSALNNSGALASLDNLLTEEQREDYYNNVLEGLTYNNELKAVCWSPSPVVLYYNKELLAKAGFNEPPKTYEEFLEMSKVISELGTDDSGNKIYGLGFQSNANLAAGFYFLSYIWANGGDIQDADGNVTLDTPEVVKALDTAKWIMENDYSPLGVSIKDLRANFAQGYVGFHIDGDFGYNTFLKLSPEGEAFADNIGIAPIPQGTGNNTGFFIEHNLAVFEASEHKEEAMKFIEYLSGPKGMAIYNANGGNKTPARHSTQEIDFYSQPENEYMQSFVQALDVARPLPQKNANFVAAMIEIADAIQRVGINGESSEDVAKDLNEKVNNLYSE